MHFARTLRAAGLPVGPGQVIEALRAVEAVGIDRRDDFYWTLHSVFVNRRDQRAIFDQAFHIFWRNPQLLERMMAMLLPSIGMPERRGEGRGDQPPPGRGAARRRGRRQRSGSGAGRGGDRARRGHDLLRPRAAAADGFRADVQRGAGAGQAAIAGMRLPIMELPTRRFAPRSRWPAHRHARHLARLAALRRAAGAAPAQAAAAAIRRWSSSATSPAR